MIGAARGKLFLGMHEEQAGKQESQCKKLFLIYRCCDAFRSVNHPDGEAAWCAAAFLVRDMARYPGRSRDAKAG